MAGWPPLDDTFLCPGCLPGTVTHVTRDASDWHAWLSYRRCPWNSVIQYPVFLRHSAYEVIRYPLSSQEREHDFRHPVPSELNRQCRTNQR